MRNILLFITSFSFLLSNSQTINLNESHSSDKSISLVRDENWFKWRILNCPYKKDLYIFNLNENYLIAHIKKRGNLKVLNIIFSSNPIKVNISKLLLGFAKKNNIEYLSHISREKRLSDLFLPWQRKLNFAFYAKDKNASNLINNSLDDIQFIDSDIDYV